MYVYDMKFYFKEDAEEPDYILSTYLCTLSGDNRIIFETLNISGNGYRRVVRVSVPYKDSLDEKYASSFGREAFAKLSACLCAPVEIEYVGEDHTYCDDIADGAKADFYVLRIHYELRDLSPICCGTTRGYIPYYLLPPLTEETTDSLTSWEVNYAAYDRLFYATGVGELSAHKMLCNISSRLNQKGLSVCRKLEAEIGKPVYYYLYRFYGKQPKKCPICGGDWKQGENSVYAYKCDACKLVADTTAEM